MSILQNLLEGEKGVRLKKAAELKIFYTVYNFTSKK